MKKGFTLLEMLVACLLLGMLVSLLTQVFSQSSIAWATGVATVKDMDDERKDIAAIQAASDDLLDKDGDMVRSVFEDMTSTSFRRRAVENSPSDNEMVSRVRGQFDSPGNWAPIALRDAQSEESGRVGFGDGSAYLVGVTSLGPDGQRGTWDDITTWPVDY